MFDLTDKKELGIDTKVMPAYKSFEKFSIPPIKVPMV